MFHQHTDTITTRTISSYIAGVIPTHTPDCPHMGAIYTMLPPCRSSCTGGLPRYISCPFQNCYDGHPSAVAGTCSCLSGRQSRLLAAIKLMVGGSNAHDRPQLVPRPVPVSSPRSLHAGVDESATRKLLHMFVPRTSMRASVRLYSTRRMRWLKRSCNA